MRLALQFWATLVPPQRPKLLRPEVQARKLRPCREPFDGELRNLSHSLTVEFKYGNRSGTCQTIKDRSFVIRVAEPLHLCGHAKTLRRTMLFVRQSQYCHVK